MYSISPIPMALSNSCSRQRACTKNDPKTEKMQTWLCLFLEITKTQQSHNDFFFEIAQYKTNHQHFKFRRIPANVEVVNQQVASSTASLCKSASHINAAHKYQIAYHLNMPVKRKPGVLPYPHRLTLRTLRSGRTQERSGRTDASMEKPAKGRRRDRAGRNPVPSPSLCRYFHGSIMSRMPSFALLEANAPPCLQASLQKTWEAM